MTVAGALMERVRSAGVEFVRRPDGTLGLRGPKAAIAALAPELRERKAEVLDVVAWLDTIGEHDPVTRAEAMDAALADPKRLAAIRRELATRAIDLAPEFRATMAMQARPAVTCGSCQHFAASETSPTAGFGQCVIESAASRKPPTLWPNARHRCRDHSPRKRK